MGQIVMGHGINTGAQEQPPNVNSVAMEITQVQESAKWLSDDFHSRAPHLPWRGLRAMRNALIHEYDGIDEDELCSTAMHDGPALARVLYPTIERLAAVFGVELDHRWAELRSAVTCPTPGA